MTEYEKGEAFGKALNKFNAHPILLSQYLLNFILIFYLFYLFMLLLGQDLYIFVLYIGLLLGVLHVVLEFIKARVMKNTLKNELLNALGKINFERLSLFYSYRFSFGFLMSPDFLDGFRSSGYRGTYYYYSRKIQVLAFFAVILILIYKFLIR